MTSAFPNLYDTLGVTESRLIVTPFSVRTGIINDCSFLSLNFGRNEENVAVLMDEADLDRLITSLARTLEQIRGIKRSMGAKS